MSARYVFGYGSLVNPATHNYDDMQPAQMVGWRRVWRHAAGREFAFLTVERWADVTIDGLVARVPDAEWPALDERERSYLCTSGEDVLHSLGPGADVSVYHAPADLHPVATRALPVLLSYLDVVVQGYLRAFGADGVARFFQTTAGWGAPVLDDRAAPRYPRAQALTGDERGLTDSWLAELGS